MRARARASPPCSGVVGVVAAFGLFYLGERVFHLGRPQLQTLMYLKLSVAGHLTIFLTRTRGPFWSIRPARILLLAVLGTQTVATLIAVYGVFMTPLGWELRAAGLGLRAGLVPARPTASSCSPTGSSTRSEPALILAQAHPRPRLPSCLERPASPETLIGPLFSGAGLLDDRPFSDSWRTRCPDVIQGRVQDRV